MIGNVIRALRESRRLTQVELATLVGISPKQVANIENGRSANLKQETIEGFAKAFGMSVPQFTEALGLGGSAPPRALGEIIGQRIASGVVHAAIIARLFSPPQPL